MNKKVNFIHFPKAAGKSIRIQLESSISNKLYLYYNNPVYHNKFRRKFIKIKHLSKIDRDKKQIIFGHYSIHDALFSINDSSNFVVIREPLDWLGSMFFYWTKKHNSKIQPIEFIKKYNLHNTFFNYLGHKPERVFDLIGFYENYSSFLEKISDKLDTDLTNIKYNVSEDAPNNYVEYLMKRDDFCQIKALMRYNNEIYNYLKSMSI